MMFQTLRYNFWRQGMVPALAGVRFVPIRLSLRSYRALLKARAA